LETTADHADYADVILKQKETKAGKKVFGSSQTQPLVLFVVFCRNKRDSARPHSTSLRASSGAPDLSVLSVQSVVKLFQSENASDQRVEDWVGAEVIELRIDINPWHPVGALCTGFVQQGKCLVLLSKGCKDRSYKIAIDVALF
jgi:hypothetical protein